MGSLSLPQGGLVYVDTQITIYSVQKHPTYLRLCIPIWARAAAGSLSVLSSELTLMEALIMPPRKGDRELADDFEQLWHRRNVRLQPVSTDILREAARLRATVPALRTPDAIHAATALISGCALFITNDRGFQRILGLVVAVLDDLLLTPPTKDQTI